MENKRKTCLICGKKRYEKFMIKFTAVGKSHYSCNSESTECKQRVSELNGQLIAIRDKDLLFRFLN